MPQQQHHQFISLPFFSFSLSKISISMDPFRDK